MNKVKSFSEIDECPNCQGEIERVDTEHVKSLKCTKCDWSVTAYYPRQA